MNYSLTSSRKVGKYYQKIITTQFGAPITPSKIMLDSLELWHELIDICNSNHDNVSEIRYLAFTENEGSGETNTSTKCDATIVVLSEVKGDAPKTTTFRLHNVQRSDFISEIYSAFNRLTAMSLDNSKNYLISAAIDIH